MKTLSGCAGAILFVAVLVSPHFSYATEEARQQILEELERLTERREAQKVAELHTAFERIHEAARTPQAAASAYANAYRDVELRGLSGQTTVFSEWRDRNDRLLASTEFRLAAQFHLRYLALTLQRSTSDNPADFLQPSIDYLKEFVEAERKIDGGSFASRREVRQLLNSSVNRGMFARAWRLRRVLESMDDWEEAPGNVEGILNNNIRPILRETQSPALLDTWDWQLAYERAKQKDVEREHLSEVFEQERIPALLFGRLRDVAALGDPLQAASEGVQILRAFPGHPQFDTWAGQIRQWLRATGP